VLAVLRLDTGELRKRALIIEMLFKMRYEVKHTRKRNTTGHTHIRKQMPLTMRILDSTDHTRGYTQNTNDTLE
jgi:hypothetical protein